MKWYTCDLAFFIYYIHVFINILLKILYLNLRYLFVIGSFVVLFSRLLCILVLLIINKIVFSLKKVWNLHLFLFKKLVEFFSEPAYFLTRVFLLCIKYLQWCCYYFHYLLHLDWILLMFKKNQTTTTSQE